MILVVAPTFAACADWCASNGVRPAECMWVPAFDPAGASARVRFADQPRMIRVNAPEAHPDVEDLLKMIRAVEITDPREIRRVGSADTGLGITLDLEEAQEINRSRTVQDIQLP